MVPDGSDRSAFGKDLHAALANETKALPEAKDVRLFSDREEYNGFTGEHGEIWNYIITVSLPVLFATGAYVGKKAIDVLTDIVKAKLVRMTTAPSEDKDNCTVMLYDGDGKVVKILRLPEKK